MKKRNRLHPAFMEVLQMLKYGLKQEQLDFSTGLMTKEEC
jgi:hypothetical protein